MTKIINGFYLPNISGSGEIAKAKKSEYATPVIPFYLGEKYYLDRENLSEVEIENPRHSGANALTVAFDDPRSYQKSALIAVDAMAKTRNGRTAFHEAVHVGQVLSGKSSWDSRFLEIEAYLNTAEAGKLNEKMIKITDKNNPELYYYQKINALPYSPCDSLISCISELYIREKYGNSSDKTFEDYENFLCENLKRIDENPAEIIDVMDQNFPKVKFLTGLIFGRHLPMLPINMNIRRALGLDETKDFLNVRD